MNVLEEIFKESPDLLNNECVKNLIKYAKDIQDRQVLIIKDYREFSINVQEAFFESNRFLIGGASDSDTMNKIMTIIERSKI